MESCALRWTEGTVRPSCCRTSNSIVRFPSLLSCLALVIFASGCSYVPAPVAERFAPAPSQDRVVGHDRAKVYVAAQDALRRMSFTLARTAEAQGVVLGRSPIVRNDAFGEKLQYEIEIHLREFGTGETKVEVWVREQVEGGLTTGGVSIKPLRTHGLYDSYFAALDQSLAAPATP